MPLVRHHEARRPAGILIDRVTRHDVGVQVRHAIAEQFEVQLQRLVPALERPPDMEDLAPVRARLCIGKLRGVGHVPSAPDDDGVTTLDVGPMQVCVGDVAGKDPCAEAVLVDASRGAKRTIFAALTLDEVVGPVSRHRNRLVAHQRSRPADAISEPPPRRATVPRSSAARIDRTDRGAESTRSAAGRR